MVNYTSSMESEIGRLVYLLYGLSEDDVLIILAFRR